MEIRYSKSSLKFLAKTDKKTVDRIREAIEKLTLVPPQGDIKAMQGYSDGRNRLRVGSFRIIYRVCSENMIDILLVIDIGNRGDIYK